MTSNASKGRPKRKKVKAMMNSAQSIISNDNTINSIIKDDKESLILINGEELLYEEKYRDEVIKFKKKVEKFFHSLSPVTKKKKNLQTINGIRVCIAF